MAGVVERRPHQQIVKTVGIDVTGAGQSVGASEMTLDAEEYTVTFADIDGAVFNVMGCAS